MKDHGNTLAQTLITDKTVVSDTARAGEVTQSITVSWLANGQKQSAEFSGSVTIGRDAACEICIGDEGVSRRHVRVYREAGQWYVTDLNSGNGTLLDAVRIQKAILPALATLRLGRGGPKIWIEASGAPASASVDEFAEHYFGDPSDQEAGHRTLMVRRAYRKLDNKKKRRYHGIIAGAADKPNGSDSPK